MGPRLPSRKVEVSIPGVPAVKSPRGMMFESEALSSLEPPFTFGAPVKSLCIESSNSSKVKEFVDYYNQKNGA